jgi:anti-sigma factor RsiW
VIFRTRNASLSCQELVELVTDYLEGALPRRQRRLFEQHISACDGCSTYLEQMRATIALTGKLEPASISPEAEAALLAAFADWRGR